MKKHVAAIFSAFAIMPIAAAYADSDFYLELGSDLNPKDVSQEWNNLVKSHKPLLEHLQFYPKSVIRSGNTVGVRIQAGPIAGKDKAQKVCSKLFKENVPCFVIEGLSNTPPAAVANLGEKPEQKPFGNVVLPWLTQNIPAPTPAPVNTAQTNAAAPAKRQADVKVAEAIRVPLTFSENQPQTDHVVVVRSLPSLKQAYHAPQVKEVVYADESAESKNGWLQVRGFLDEGIASSFWDEVRVTSPKQTNKLRVSYDKPTAQNQHKTSMKIGPFASSSEAYQFCRNSIQASERGLDCSFAPIDDNVKYASATPLPSTHAAVNEVRSDMTPLLTSPGMLAPAAGPSRQYWIQVLSATSQMEAMNRWEELKADNADLLGGLRSNVSGSLTNRSSYFVRVGPMASNETAVDTCAKMQERGIRCNVLMYSNNP